MASNISSISQALAGKPNLLNIPNSAPANISGHYQGLIVSKRHGAAIGLLTPPNSISPNLPPQAFRAAKYAADVAGSPPSQVDSDIDLQDAVEHARNQAHGAHGLSSSADDVGAEGVGIITPAYLAKFHLADLVLEKGPIAIRHVMNHLAQTVPGFSEIPPAKARRIVVAALESRAGGGAKGDVEFEKVGWGRWDARVKGHAGKTSRTMYPIREGDSSEVQSPPTAALRIPGSDRRPSKVRRISHGSWPAEFSLSTRLEHTERTPCDVAEDEADKMSIDGDEGERPPTRQSSAYAQRPSMPENYSDTDEEDWATLGAEALRKGSYASSFASGAGRSAGASGIHNYMGRPGSLSAARRSSSFSPHPSLGQHQYQHSSSLVQQRRKSSKGPDLLKFEKLDFTGVEVDSQEREAIQALLRMGSL